jgi:hypothetical protein
MGLSLDPRPVRSKEERREGDIPWSLTIWQRGFRISIEVYGPAATSDTLPAKQREDDVPF